MRRLIALARSLRVSVGRVYPGGYPYAIVDSDVGYVELRLVSRERAPKVIEYDEDFDINVDELGVS